MYTTRYTNAAICICNVSNSPDIIRLIRMISVLIRKTGIKLDMVDFAGDNLFTCGVL
jgi:hypothetical protein